MNAERIGWRAQLNITPSQASDLITTTWQANHNCGDSEVQRISTESSVILGSEKGMFEGLPEWQNQGQLLKAAHKTWKLEREKKFSSKHQRRIGNFYFELYFSIKLRSLFHISFSMCTKLQWNHSLVFLKTDSVAMVTELVTILTSL